MAFDDKNLLATKINLDLHTSYAGIFLSYSSLVTIPLTTCILWLIEHCSNVIMLFLNWNFQRRPF